MPDPILRALTEAVENRHPVVLATVVAGKGRFEASVGCKAVVWLDQEPLGRLRLGALETQVLADVRQVLAARAHQLLTYREGDDTLTVFVEVQRRPPTIIIAGAGHVAQPLVEIAHICQFHVIVLDNRTAFATRERFPTADEVIAAPFRKTLREMPIDLDTYIVLVTRGHQHDVDCLLEVIDRPAAYIGMIGSQRRVRAVFDLMESEEGIEPEKLDRVYSPIGLEIGAQTPADIAVSIMGEIIKVLRGNMETVKNRE